MVLHMFYCSAIDANKDTYHILYIFIRNKCSWQRKEKKQQKHTKVQKNYNSLRQWLQTALVNETELTYYHADKHQRDQHRCDTASQW